MFVPAQVLNYTFVYLCVVPVAVVIGQAIDQTYVVENGTTIVIPCNLTLSYDYPSWMGPPVWFNGLLTTYNIERSSNFFTSLENRDRISWDSNKKDLVLSEVMIRLDEGRYQCAGTWTSQLNVRGIYSIKN